MKPNKRHKAVILKEGESSGHGKLKMEKCRHQRRHSDKNLKLAAGEVHGTVESGRDSPLQQIYLFRYN